MCSAGVVVAPLAEEPPSNRLVVWVATGLPSQVILGSRYLRNSVVSELDGIETLAYLGSRRSTELVGTYVAPTPGAR